MLALPSFVSQLVREVNVMAVVFTAQSGNREFTLTPYVAHFRIPVFPYLRIPVFLYFLKAVSPYLPGAYRCVSLDLGWKLIQLGRHTSECPG